MGQRHGLQVFASIEELVGEGCNVWMHASLTTQDGCKCVTTSLALLSQQTFEERQAAFVQRGLVVGLLHHSRQLLMIANKDEAIDAIRG